MVKDHSGSERGNLLLSLHELGIFYMHNLTDRIVHTTALVIPAVEHSLENYGE